MTSNIGARHISNQSTLGFRDSDEEQSFKDMQKRVLEEVKNVFNPEFINRLDDIIVFRSLNFNNLKEIAHLMINELNENIKERQIFVTCTDKVYERLAEKAWEKDRKFGARPLRRVIQNEIEDLISDKLLINEIKSGDPVIIDLEDENFIVSTESIAVTMT
jgi:ATP-dependent Clp protease ATP-binding subunit ClpC